MAPSDWLEARDVARWLAAGWSNCLAALIVGGAEVGPSPRLVAVRGRPGRAHHGAAGLVGEQGRLGYSGWKATSTSCRSTRRRAGRTTGDRVAPQQAADIGPATTRAPCEFPVHNLQGFLVQPPDLVPPAAHVL